MSCDIHTTITGISVYIQLQQLSTEIQVNIKPIFHQNAKLLALGTFASANAKDSTFALPNAKNTNMLVSLVLGDANFLCQPCTFHFFV